MAEPARLDSNASELLRDDADSVCTLTLNRPEARNALSEELIDALQGELDSIAKDESVRVVVIAATGSAFCAGHDLRQMRAHPTLDYYETLFAKCSRLMMSILRLPQPVIARVQGTATAAGSQLLATCDLAVAAESAEIATPGVHIGLFCSTPMVAVSRNIGRKKMMEMLILGSPVTAREAERLGLVNRVVADSELDAAVADYCRTITAKSAMVLRIGKEAFYRQLELGIEDAYAYTAAVMAQNMMAEDAVEGIDAFLAKRSPIWKDR